MDPHEAKWVARSRQPGSVNRGRRSLLIASAAATAGTLGVDMAAATADRVSAPAVHVDLRAVVDAVAIRSDAPTRDWRYRAALVRGTPGALEASAGRYLGPIIRVLRGQRVRIDLINELP